MAAVFPNEDDMTVVVAGPHRSRLAEFRADPEDAYLRVVTRLPGGPDLAGAERASKLIGALDVPNVMRPAARPGVALVGDAALAADPVFGVGCGWAFQSAEWLVDHTAAAVVGDRDLDRALDRYRRAFRRRLGLHHYWQVTDFAAGRKLRPTERIAFHAAATDPAFARVVEEVASRRRSSLRMLDPRLVPRVLRAFGDTRRMAEAVRTRIGADARLPTRRTLDERLLVRWPGLWPVFARAAQILPPRSRLRRAGLRRAALSGWGAWVRGDLDLCLVRFSPDFHYEPPREWLIAGMPSAYRGHAGLREWSADLREAWEFLDHLPLEVVDSGDVLAFLCRIRLRARSSGIEIDTRLGQIFWSERGLIARERDFSDWDEARARLESCGSRLYPLTDQQY